MGLFTRSQKSQAERRDSLNAVPYLRNGVTVTTDENGLSVVSFEEKRGGGFLDRFRPAVTLRSYELDEFGTFVLEQIDSRRSVLQLADSFRDRFSMSRRECELGVAAFIKLLLQRRVIDIIPGSGE